MILALSHAKIKTNLYSYNKFVPNYTWKHIQMKVLYLFLIFSFIALNNTLTNNNTCQCTCHDPYITEKGNIIFMLQINLLTCPCLNSTSIYLYLHYLHPQHLHHQIPNQVFTKLFARIFNTMESTYIFPEDALLCEQFVAKLFLWEKNLFCLKVSIPLYIIATDTASANDIFTFLTTLSKT